VRKILSPRRVAGVSNLSNDRGQRAGNMGIEECCSGFGELVRQPVHYTEVQRDRGPTGSLELHGKRRSRKSPKYPRRTLVGETPGLWRGRQEPIESWLGKGPIKSGMFSDGSDTIPDNVPV